VSLHRLRARLDRLEETRAKLAEQDGQDGAVDFRIDPAFAKSLRDDYERMNKLSAKQHSPGKNGGPLSPAEVEELSRLNVSLPERARMIEIPESYGPYLASKDSNRLSDFFRKRITPPSCGGGALTAAEDAEEAQLRARALAFAQRPEKPSDSEENERLRREHPLYEAGLAWDQALREHEKEWEETLRKRGLRPRSAQTSD
jgi:hypothetical protein